MTETRSLPIMPGMPIARAKAPPIIQVPDGKELPLFDKNSPTNKQIQQYWKANVAVFDLSDDEQRTRYESAWQKITEGQGAACENRVEFSDGKYIAYLRWAEFEYKLPQ